ncbi:hypothetical protein HaLaN_31562, partial [Haematococcus lacustris]
TVQGGCPWLGPLGLGDDGAIEVELLQLQGQPRVREKAGQTTAVDVVAGCDDAWCEELIAALAVQLDTESGGV